MGCNCNSSTKASDNSSGSFVMPSIGQALHGGKQLVKMALGLNRLDNTAIGIRLDKCSACYHATKGIDETSQCRKCACFIQLKVRAKDESCPMGMW